MELFAPQTSLDRFLSSAVFVIGILSDSEAAKAAKRIDDAYATRLKGELAKICGKIEASGLINRIRIVLIYIPLATKGELVTAFDSKLKGLQ
jgi:predicted HAD superfamily phosphohydrolase